MAFGLKPQRLTLQHRDISNPGVQMHVCEPVLRGVAGITLFYGTSIGFYGTVRFFTALRFALKST